MFAIVTAAIIIAPTDAAARHEREPRARRPRWHVGDEVPEGFHTETRRRTELATFGVVLAGIPYVLGVPFALDYHDREARWLLVPIAGPILYAGSIRDRGDARFESAAILLLDFAAQTTGTILAIAGASTQSTFLVKNDVSIRVAPSCVSTGCAVTAVGTF